MTKIKTVAFLMKCLRVDIPIYKDVNFIALRIHRVVLYKTSLIEIMDMVSKNALYILLDRQHADYIIDAATEAERERLSASLNKKVTTLAPKETPKEDVKEEPGYEVIVEVPEEATTTTPESSQVSTDPATWVEQHAY